MSSKILGPNGEDPADFLPRPPIEPSSGYPLPDTIDVDGEPVLIPRNWNYTRVDTWPEELTREAADRWFFSSHPDEHEMATDEAIDGFVPEAPINPNVPIGRDGKTSYGELRPVPDPEKPLGPPSAPPSAPPPLMDTQAPPAPDRLYSEKLTGHLEEGVEPAHAALFAIGDALDEIWNSLQQLRRRLGE